MLDSDEAEARRWLSKKIGVLKVPGSMTQTSTPKG